MIQIVKGSSNTVCATCTEKNTLTTPYYLFVFESEQSNVKYYCVGTDISSYPERYQKFTIVETATPTLANHITLSVGGFYNYTIYEQVSSTNTDIANATGIVEIGKAQVTDVASTAYTFTNTDTSIVYNG